MSIDRQVDNPVDISNGRYADAYFNKVRQILNHESHDPVVTVQIFQRREAVLCGVKSAVNQLRINSHHQHVEFPEVLALPEGVWMNPWDTAMLIKGRYSTFAHMETTVLGVLARQTRVATNVKKVVEAAEGKPVFFMPARHDHPLVQADDGYAALLAGAASVSTDAQSSRVIGQQGQGTMPHSLIAAFGGDIRRACRAYANTFPGEKVTALVDFNNNCVADSVLAAQELGDQLGAVRLDTSGGLIDEGLVATIPRNARSIYGRYLQTVEAQKHQMPNSFTAVEKPEDFAHLFGVSPALVNLVRSTLDGMGRQDVKIVVSGGFDARKIREFEFAEVPVDVYGVGSSLIQGKYDFTADIVEVDGSAVAKKGRGLRENDKLEVQEMEDA